MNIIMYKHLIHIELVFKELTLLTTLAYPQYLPAESKWQRAISVVRNHDFIPIKCN